MKLGVSGELTVLNECSKFQKNLPYGSRGCHLLQWHKNNNNTYNNNRFPPDGGTLIIPTNIAAGSNGGFLQRLRTREKCIFCTICHYRKIHAADLPMGYLKCNTVKIHKLQAKERA